MKHFWSIFAILCLCCNSASAKDKPNILVIVVDDLGYADIGVHGSKLVPTPNINALAASGVRCTNGYVSAPYCSPSRAGLLTGRYQTRFGHEFNPPYRVDSNSGLPRDQRTIADFLHEAGYATGLVGKWHEGLAPEYHPQARGFDDFFGFLAGDHNFILHSDARRVPFIAFANAILRGHEVQKLDGYATDAFSEEAVAFIDRQAEKPWFLYLAYNAVHTPLEINERHRDRIPADVTDPARRGYLSLLLGLDDGIGQLMKHLRETGKDKDTLIFFFSDNGGSGHKPFMAYNAAVNTPLRGDKAQTLEGGIRVPFFVSWPGKLQAGKVYEQPVIALDVLPTVLTLAGHSVPADCDGVDLMPHLKGASDAAPHNSLYWRFGPQKAVRHGPLKLVDWRDFETGKSSGWQLYDLSSDVGEQHDLAAAKPELVAQLSGEWDTWNAKNVPPLWHAGPQEDPRDPSDPAAKKN